MRKLNRNEGRRIVCTREQEIQEWFISEDPKLILTALELLQTYNPTFISTMRALYRICERYDFSIHDISDAIHVQNEKVNTF